VKVGIRKINKDRNRKIEGVFIFQGYLLISILPEPNGFS